MTARVGIVVVSHSAALADAVVDLATQMVADDPPPIAVAGGADDGGLGTDAMAVLGAIESVASERGVLVVMDLGSAVLSAEMALEFLGEVDYRVQLTSAAMVEGVVAAVVQAALGSDLDTVAAEAGRALAAKRDHVGDATGHDAESLPGNAAAADVQEPAPDAVVEVGLVNEHGLHARPAAAFVREAARHDATITVTNVTTGAGPGAANSLSAIARLGAEPGHVLRIEASGADAVDAVDALQAMVDEGFGERRVVDVDGTEAGTVPHQAGVDAAAAVDPDASSMVGIAPGRAIGPVLRMVSSAPPPSELPTLPPDEREEAVARLHDAVDSVAGHLEQLAEESDHHDVAAVITATAGLARDPAIVDVAATSVRESGMDPVMAVVAAVAPVAEAFTARGGLMASRRRDVEDVRDRIVAHLLGSRMPAVPSRADPFVLVARDPGPADVAALAGSGCLGLVVGRGSPDAHVAIIARALGLPAVVAGDRVDAVDDGDVVFVDGERGELWVSPSGAPVAATDNS